ncbi:MAG: hypothetical protein M1816_000730 [Peltula sp. TS41687]|nr:MAG: hypothetical protein M1816_000730 [Peltula sp. TS41687]
MGSSRAERRAKAAAQKNRANDKKRKADEITNEPSSVHTRTRSKSVGGLVALDENALDDSDDDDDANRMEAVQKLKRQLGFEGEVKAVTSSTDDDQGGIRLVNGHEGAKQEETPQQQKKRKRSDSNDGSGDEKMPDVRIGNRKETGKERHRREKREKKLEKRERKIARMKKSVVAEGAQGEEQNVEMADGDASTTAMQIDEPGDGRPQSKASKKTHSRRKRRAMLNAQRKTEAREYKAMGIDAPPTAAPAKDPNEVPQQSERQRARKRRRPDPGDDVTAGLQRMEITDDAPIEPAQAEEDDGAAAAQKKHRFIVFVGNIPYTTTTESVEAHFASLNPAGIRYPMNEEKPNLSKGFAFVEFDGHEKMETCLHKFHHSQIDDGQGGKRRINVELSAGGGGSKSHQRREKIKTKNDKLNEERKNRVLKEEKAKVEGGAGAGAGSVGTEAEAGMGAIHPSRRSRVQGA